MADISSLRNYFSDISPTVKKVVFFSVIAACLSSYISPPIALLLGLIIAQTIGHPYRQQNSKATRILLQFSVVGLGFGMNVISAMKAGREGVLYTVISIISTFILGYTISKLMQIESKTAYLISAGTAICGGSAIAAVSPVIKAEEKHISVALGIIFILNSIALFTFPAIGHACHMSQTQFGLWCAIAIHDTSSVFGASSRYGAEALGVATTVKLARALWIIPVAFISALIFKSNASKVSIPWFIAYFILAIIVNTYVPLVNLISPYIVFAAKLGLTVTLFLIGAGLSGQVLRSVGIKPLILGVLLWLFISLSSLYLLLQT